MSLDPACASLCMQLSHNESQPTSAEQSLRISKSQVGEVFLLVNHNLYMLAYTYAHSPLQALRGLVKGGGVEVEECVQVIAREKKINLRAHPG